MPKKYKKQSNPFVGDTTQVTTSKVIKWQIKCVLTKYCNIETIILLHNTLPVYTVCIFKQFWIPVYIYNIIKSTKWFIVNPENTYKIKVIHSQSRKHLQDQSDSKSTQKTPTR